jgi:hypothetical protein
MKMADILRGLADKLDGIEGGEETGHPANTGPTADHFQHNVDDGSESDDCDIELTDVMVPPLQAKLELLKKATGVNNVYDGSDELDAIKKLTGIKAVIGHEAGEDNDITG